MTKNELIAAVAEKTNLGRTEAAAAVEAIGTLLPGAAPARLSVPGPLGLPGGFPVRVDDGEVSLDLPAGQPFDDPGPRPAGKRG